MTFATSRQALPLAKFLRYNAPNTIKVARVNNDSIDPANPNDPDSNPSPIEDTDATVDFTVYEAGRTNPFTAYDHVSLAWVAAVGDEPAHYHADLPATTTVPPGQYYGEITITKPGFSPAPIRLVVTVGY